MPVFNNALAGAAGSAGGAGGFKIERSLRFNNDDSAYLNRAVSSNGNRRTWTWSCWIKRSGLADRQEIFAAGNDGTDFFFDANDKLNFYYYQPGVDYRGWCLTDSVFRDVSAWYHIVLVFDSTQSTASDRVKIYVNNVRQPLTFTHNFTQNDEAHINSNSTHYIGRYSNGNTEFADYYLAEAHFVDGQALTPTNFGEFDADTGVWNPIEYTGSHNAAAVGLGGVTWSSYVSGPVNSTKPLSNCFGGTIGSGYQQGTTATGGNALTLNVSALNLTVTNVRLNSFIGGSPGTLTVNGSNVSYSGSGDQTQVVAVNGQLNTIVWGYDNGNNYVYMRGIEVDLGDGSGYRLLTDGAGSPAGVNGFHLDFSDNSSAAALGYDAAGSNNWTVNNIQATSFDALGNVSHVGPGNLTSIATGTYYNLVHVDSDGVSSDPVSGALFRFNFSALGLTAPATITFDSYEQGGGGWTTVSTNVYTDAGTVTSTTSSNGNTRSNTVNIPSGATYLELPGSYNSQYSLYSNGINNLVWGGTSYQHIGPEAIDSLLDSPTNYQASSGNNGGNYATFNALDSENGTLSNGNLTTNQTNTSVSFGPQNTTIGVSSGKWYCEFTWDSGTYALVGITHAPSAGKSGTTWHRDADTYTWYFSGAFMSAAWPGTSTFPDGSNPTFTVGDIVGVLLDKDNDKLYFTKNGSYVASMNAATGANGIDISAHSGKTAFITCGNNASTATQLTLNAGQRPFAASSIPTGFKSLCTTNLDDPLIANPSTAFDVARWTGNGGTQSITTTGMSPDLVWLKARSVAYSHNLVDSIRGVTKYLFSNNTNAEATDLDTITSLNSDGFSLGPDYGANELNSTFVGWTWDAGTVGANEVGSYWSPAYQTKYIGFKFPTSSGGRAVFGLTSGTGTADIFTSSDNNSWTRVQSNVTLSTTDTTYDSTSQYLIVVNTSNAVWGGFHYAMATNGTDAHYSTQTYPGSGASFTWSGPTYTDWDFRSSGTVIKPGSLNSSAYNQSQNWTNNVSSTSNITSGQESRLFNGQLTGSGADIQSSQGTSGVINFTNAITGSKIEIFTIGNVGQIGINGGNLTVTANQWVDTGVTSLTSVETRHPGAGLIQNPSGLKVDGKILVDSGLSVTNVPSIASTVRANPSAGFSIVSYTGDGSGTDTIGHGLNDAPSLVITKSRGTTGSWRVFADVGGTWKLGNLNNTDAFVNATVSAATSSVFSIDGNSNASTTHIAYCFAPVAGYSAFGSYTGNGSADGPFVFTGMRPRWVLLKNSSSGNVGYDWLIYDTQRDTYNVGYQFLCPNSNNVELRREGDTSNKTDRYIDILSNGFKIRNSNANYNGNGDTFVYAAFAENPFKTARAR